MFTKCSFGLHSYGKWEYREENWVRKYYGSPAFGVTKVFRKRTCTCCGKIVDEFVHMWRINN